MGMLPPSGQVSKVKKKWPVKWVISHTARLAKKEFPQHFWLLQNDQEIKKVRKKYEVLSKK
jgi:hypothetical protein